MDDRGSVSGASVAGSRYETFTEAVPLSLSSMAHSNIPLDGGVLDGVKQVLGHTMLSCVNYARTMYPPHNWTFRDLVTSPHSWKAFPLTKKNKVADDIPFALERMQFRHQYCRNAFIYLKPALQEMMKVSSTTTKSVDETNAANTDDNEEEDTTYGFTFEKEIEILEQDNWQNEQMGIMGRVSFLYISTEPLTPGEMDGTEVDEIPPCILYKVVVEYRSLPASGKGIPIVAEELSMLSFGGSVDDDVKYGALASLYDENAKYVLEIFSVRGKKYKFDLMDSTLSDGAVPRLPTQLEGHPFAKCLCVTVSNHKTMYTVEEDIAEDEEMKQQALEKEVDAAACGTPKINNNGNDDNKKEDDEEQHPAKRLKTGKNYAITRMNLSLEGKPRIASSDGSLDRSLNGAGDVGELFDNLPSFDYMSSCIASTFLSLNPNPPLSVSAHPSGHTLILDPAYAGYIYVNGRYITTWHEDVRIAGTGTALYGMDLHSIPFWHGRIVDYDVLKESYAQLWQELLVDAKVVHLELSRSLLYRLMKGKEPKKIQSNVNGDIVEGADSAHADVDYEYDDDEYDNDNAPMDTEHDRQQDENYHRHQELPPAIRDVNFDCLETQVLGSATQYDRVGIAAKALATRFAAEFGQDGYPCLAHETAWVKRALPGRRPIVVPQRLITILRRGGFFNIQQTADSFWFENTRPISEGVEMDIVSAAVQMLEKAECTFADTSNICIVTTPVSSNVITLDAVCRYNEETEHFYVHEQFMKTDFHDYLQTKKSTSKTTVLEESSEKPPPTNGKDDTTIEDEVEAIASLTDDPVRIKSFLLGMYIAKAHPYGKVLVKYLMRNRP